MLGYEIRKKKYFIDQNDVLLFATYFEEMTIIVHLFFSCFVTSKKKNFFVSSLQ